MAGVSNLTPTWNLSPGIPAIPLDALPFPVALLDSDAVFTAVNAGWCRVHPEARAGESGLAFCDRVHQSRPELRAAVVAGLEGVLNRIRNHFVQDYAVGGDLYRLAISACPGGALVAHMQIDGQESVPDAERQRQSQRMEAVGRLVGGVAHDFANLVTLISGYCEILLARLGDRDPLRPELAEIGRAANRGALLTTQLLSYTRGKPRKPCALDLNAIVSDLERMLRPIIGEHVEIDTVLDAGLGKVVADAGQMEQVLMNLLLNARDAMPRGGRIAIETVNVQLDECAGAGAGLPPGAYVSLAVTDTGRGIDPESLKRVFEPFFTTKAEGKGTGLGLSTVQTIMAQSGGAVAVQSVVGEGSEFRIYLPRVLAPAERSEPRAAAPAVAGNETILLVEDDDSVRQLLAHLLHRKGYRVLQAASGEEAESIFASHGAEIQLVLTDMIMPGMSGRDLAELLLADNPHLRVVFMSGYTDDVLTNAGALRPGMSFLQKPLHPDVLAAKIRETLDSPLKPFDPA